MSRVRALIDALLLERDWSYLAADGACGFTQADMDAAPAVELEDD